MKEEASLACLVNLSDLLYENFELDFPAHVLEWDIAGSIEVSADNELLLEAGEIKSSQRCKSSFDMHPLLKSPTLARFGVRARQMATGAANEVAFPGAP